MSLMHRPNDHELVRRMTRQLRRAADLPVVFSGVGNSRMVSIDESVGLQTKAIKGLRIIAGEGLGGIAMRDRRPVAVSDYEDSESITRSYSEAVRAEGINAVMAIPVVVSEEVRMVLYGATRKAGSIGDKVRRTAVELARATADELRIRDEVDRRMSMLDAAPANLQPSELASVDRENLRVLYADLRSMAAGAADDEMKSKLLGASDRLAEVVGMRKPQGGVAEGMGASGAARAQELADVPQLTMRELDVVSQIALGCTNAEAAHRLGLSTETVKAYLRNVGIKLGVSGRHAIVSRARACGLIL